MTPLSPSPVSPNLLLVEDDHRFAQWTQAVLQKQCPDLHVAVAHNLLQARHWLAGTHTQAWQLAIVDLNLGDESGVDLIYELAAHWPQLPVLVVTSVDAPDKALHAIRAGAQGYILKATIESELVRVVQQTRDGGSPITPSIARQLLSTFRTIEAVAVTPPGPGGFGLPVPDEVLQKLSAREAEVLRLLARGYSNKEAAVELTISPATVDSHVRKIFRKLSINSRVELRRLLGA